MTSIPGSELAALWTLIALLLVSTRLVAAIGARLRQPPVVAALVVGLILSPDLLGRLWPSAQHWLIPHNEAGGHLLGGLAQLSLLVVSFVLGLETDATALRRMRRALTITTSMSLALPLAGGVVVGMMVPSEFVGAAGTRVSVVVLFATITAVSSLPVIAWIIRELGVTDNSASQLAIGSAAVQDGVGFVLLALGVSLGVNEGPGRLIVVALGLVGVLGLVAIFGHRVADSLLLRSNHAPASVRAPFAVMVSAMFALAAACQAVHVDGAFGAFLAGLLLGQSTHLQPSAVKTMEAAAIGLFAPLYFGVAGLELQLHTLGERDIALSALGVVVVGLATKSLGSYSGARLSGIGPASARMVASVLNGRGTMQVIVASVALRHDVISSSAYTVIICSALATTIVVAPIVRGTLGPLLGAEHEGGA